VKAVSLSLSKPGAPQYLQQYSFLPNASAIFGRSSAWLEKRPKKKDLPPGHHTLNGRPIWSNLNA
jgi:hypothetical protein